MSFDWFHDPQVPHAEKLHPKESTPKESTPKESTPKESTRSNWEGLAARESAPAAPSTPAPLTPEYKDLVLYLRRSVLPMLPPPSRAALRARIEAVGDLPFSPPITPHAAAVISKTEQLRADGLSWPRVVDALNEHPTLNPRKAAQWTRTGLRNYIRRNTK
jgi:hypothetical protein